MGESVQFAPDSYIPMQVLLCCHPMSCPECDQLKAQFSNLEQTYLAALSARLRVSRVAALNARESQWAKDCASNLGLRVAAAARPRFLADFCPALVTQPEVDRGIFERQDERRVDIRLTGSVRHDWGVAQRRRHAHQ